MRRADALALAAMAGWGLAYVPSAWMIEDWPPLVAAGARFVAGGLLLAVALLAVGRGLRPRVGPGVVIWVALTQTVLFYGAVFWGIAHAGAGLSALLSNLDPLFVAILAAVVLGERLSPRQWCGIGIGLVGAGVVVWDGPLWPPAVSGAALVVIGGAVAWSIGTIVVARGVRGRADPLALAVWQMLAGGAALAAIGAATTSGPVAADARPIALALLTGIIGAALPLALFYLALMRAPAGEVSAWFFLVPVIGVVSAWALLGETPDPSLVFGLVTICGGLWLVMAQRGPVAGGLVKSPPPP
jgi:drug/metabolite transporter (DMT)-like permease